MPPRPFGPDRRLGGAGTVDLTMMKYFRDGRRVMRRLDLTKGETGISWHLKQQQQKKLVYHHSLPLDQINHKIGVLIRRGHNN
jgi:hypothetical protein